MDWKPPPDVTPRHLDWRDEIEIAIRDALACRRCDTPLVEERDRVFVLIDPDAGQALENTALVCIRCRREHADWPQPMPHADGRVETVC
jgi:hypothetical protein